MWSGITRAQSLKKVVDGGGQGVEDSSEVELTEDKFGQGGLEAVHISGRKFKVVWRVLWIAGVGMATMEGNHWSSVWRVVWVAIVEAGMVAMEGSHGLSMKALNARC